MDKYWLDRDCRSCGEPCHGTYCRKCFEKKGAKLSQLKSVKRYENKNVKNIKT